MFSYSVREGDRCELCRYKRCEGRTMSLPPGSLVGYGQYPYQQVDVLVCYRMPPTANERGDGVWPIVQASGWCGEFSK